MSGSEYLWWLYSEECVKLCVVGAPFSRPATKLRLVFAGARLLSSECNEEHCESLANAIME